MLGPARHDLHVFDADPDILCGQIAPPEAFHDTSIGLEQLRRLVGFAVGNDHHRLAAAIGQTGKGVLVAHAARQAERIAERLGFRVVRPHPASPEARTERRAVQSDKTLEPALGVEEGMNRFMVVKIRIGEYRHVALLDGLADMYRALSLHGTVFHGLQHWVTRGFCVDSKSELLVLPKPKEIGFRTSCLAGHL